MNDIVGVTTIVAAYVVGIIFSIVVTRRILLHRVLQQAVSAVEKRTYYISAIIGATVGLFPAVYFSFLFGGNFGGAIGDYIGAIIGLSSLGVPIGIFAGISITFSIMLIFSTFIGIIIAKAII